MTTVWRLSAANGLLLAAYFIPAWVKSAGKLLGEPIRGLYDTTNIASAMLISDQLQFLAPATYRFALLLALAKLTVAAFFAVSAAFTIRAVVTRRGDGQEALALALAFGGLISVLNMAIAAHVGEMPALRLHATESLLILGTAVVMLFEPSAAAVEQSQAAELPVHSEQATAVAGASVQH